MTTPTPNRYGHCGNSVKDIVVVLYIIVGVVDRSARGLSVIAFVPPITWDASLVGAEARRESDQTIAYVFHHS